MRHVNAKPKNEVVNRRVLIWLTPEEMIQIAKTKPYKSGSGLLYILGSNHILELTRAGQVYRKSFKFRGDGSWEIISFKPIKSGLFVSIEQIQGEEVSSKSCFEVPNELLIQRRLPPKGYGLYPEDKYANDMTYGDYIRAIYKSYRERCKTIKTDNN